MAPPRSKTLSDRPDIPAFRSALGSRRWTPADAQVVLAAHQESGLTLAAFARRHRLSLQRLYAWRRHLDSARRPDVTRSPQFLPVRVVGPAVEPPDPLQRLRELTHPCLPELTHPPV